MIPACSQTEHEHSFDLYEATSLSFCVAVDQDVIISISVVFSDQEHNGIPFQQKAVAFQDHILSTAMLPPLMV